jgi:hypothetical protein
MESGGRPDCVHPFSTGFPAFFQPTMPCGMMYTFVYPSFSAATAAVWQACQASS